MTQYIAFLRAINVGGHTVRMERLRAFFAELEFSNVATFIASGNVIFEAPAGNARELEEQIAAHLRQVLGYEVATFIRSPADLVAVVGYKPFPAAELDVAGVTLSIAFLPEPSDVEPSARSWHSDPRSTTFVCMGARSTGCAARGPPSLDSPGRFSRRRSACPPRCATRTR